MTKDIEREAFEKALAGNKIHNLKVCTIFDDEKNEYFASDVCDPSEDHIVESINLSWRMWQAAKAHETKKLEGCLVVPETEFDELKAKLSKYDNKLYFSHDANSGGFQYHTTLEGAKAEAESNLDWYRDRVADGHHVADDGDFAEVCYGIALATADYNIDDVVTKEHHENNEWTKYEVGTEILSLNLYEEVVEAARGGK